MKKLNPAKKILLIIFFILAKSLNVQAYIISLDILKNPNTGQTIFLFGDQHEPHASDAISIEKLIRALTQTKTQSKNFIILTETPQENLNDISDLTGDKPKSFLELIKEESSKLYPTKNIDFRVISELMGDFFNSETIPAIQACNPEKVRAGLSLNFYQYRFTDLLSELKNKFIEISKNKKISDLEFFSELNTQLTIAEESFKEKLREFGIPEETSMLKVSKDLLLANLKEITNRTELYQKVIDFEILINSYAERYPNTSGQERQIIFEELRKIVINILKQLNIKFKDLTLNAKKILLKKYYLDLSIPIFDINLLNEILINQDQENIIVFSGALHTETVSMLLNGFYNYQKLLTIKTEDNPLDPTELARVLLC